MDINGSPREVTSQPLPNTVTSPWRASGEILQINLWGSLRQHLMLPPTLQGRGQSLESCRTTSTQGRLLYLCLTHRVHASMNLQTLDQKTTNTSHSSPRNNKLNNTNLVSVSRYQWHLLHTL